MKHLRTLSTTRLVGLFTLVVALLAAVAALAVAASGSNGTTPPPKPLDVAIHDALASPPPAGVTARVRFTNKLFPSGALLGNAGPVLMSGGSGRLWMTGDGRGRIELQSNAGDAQIIWTTTDLTIYDASSNTAYHATLPASSATDTPDAPPSLAHITDLLTQLDKDVTVSAAQPTSVAGVPAYSVSLAPKHDGGMLGSVELAWDADHGVPLRYLLIDPRVHARQVLLQPAEAIADGAHAHRHVALGHGHGVERLARLERIHPSKPALQSGQFAHDFVVGSISVHPLPLGCSRDGPGASARMVRTSAVRGNSAASDRCIMVR
jgi:hypothetical protein